jgi:putative flippase GtrA
VTVATSTRTTPVYGLHGRGQVDTVANAIAVRLRGLLADQRVRYLMVGGTNTVVGYAVFAVFDLTVFAHLTYGHLLSLFPAYAITIVLAFTLYRRFVFHVSGQVGRDFLAFVGVNMVAIGTNLVVLAALVDLVGVPSLVAQAIALAVTVVVGYFGHREVSFRRPGSGELAGGQTAEQVGLDGGDPHS